MTNPFPEPAPDFSDPLGMLRACHQRMLSNCDLLEKLAAHMEKSGADDDARAAAQRVHRYFSTAAQFHHQDEEEDVFPRLVRTSLKLATVINDLKQDHEKIQAAWQDLEPMLRQIHHIGDMEMFRQVAGNFANLYRQHIKVEERDFLDTAQHLLSSEQLAAIGESMQERRQQADQET
jgi:hemerythrin-like domain-containing protein